MSRGWGAVTDHILLLLADGPMTLPELMAETGATKNALSKALSALRRTSPQFPKRIYISSWVFHADGQRKYPRAVYKLGTHHCKAKPVADQNRVKREYWMRRKARLQQASVFRLGQQSSMVMRAQPKDQHAAL